MYGIGQKGAEVLKALGKRRKDFTQQELRQYGEYCRNDVALCSVIAHMQRPRLPQAELQTIDSTVKKFVRPRLAVDIPAVKGRLKDIQEKKQATLEALGLEDRKVLMSNGKFAEALRSLGVTPPLKPSPSDPAKTTYAFAKTDQGMRDLLEHENTTVAALAAARLEHKSTIEESRAKKLIETTQYSGGELCVPLLYWGAHTGRFSGSGGINLQNLSKKSFLRSVIKAAKPGEVVLAGDLSQIEARLVAALADETQLLDAFAYGRDVYCEFGSVLYGKPINKDDHPNERFVAKCAVLMLGYGAGANKFYTTMRAWGAPITKEEAEHTVQVYRNTYTCIRNLWRRLDGVIESMASYSDFAQDLKCIRFGYRRWQSPCGVDIMYPKLALRENDWSFKYRDREWRRLYGGALLENICQHLGRVILSQAELRMEKHGFRAAMSVHDELVYTVPEEKVGGFKKLLEIELTRPVEWLPELPVACEIKYGETYADCK